MATTHALKTERTEQSSNRLLLVIGLGVGALVVAAVAIVLLLPRSGPTYPAGSPEAAFQAYLIASEAYDFETAYQAFSPRVRATWSYDDFARERNMYGYGGNKRSVWIDSVDRHGDRAVLGLTIEWVSGEGLTSSRGYDRDVRIAMILDDGTWYIDQSLMDTPLNY